MINRQTTRKDTAKLECIRGDKSRPAAPEPRRSLGSAGAMNYYIWKHIEKSGME